MESNTRRVGTFKALRMFPFKNTAFTILMIYILQNTRICFDLHVLVFSKRVV
ncbi:unnamed protein product [Acanthoscelides obtectus]|uniref:Uncharacterized protein n=1 Tax=Acanthoscelides obtectus TaxID=200917 RepID=A0A9P0M9F5_ACAOB|nr:unnamed protein product [Acanthoscelides obtectus]CAK1686912.1 hypothetical protein AOBTE_LOCUS36145 [Acanthoscelides obtectus]